MELRTVKITEIIPYGNNPRINDSAVDDVMESIRQCEYIAPIIVDENMMILAGHTRQKSMIKLGYEECQVIVKEGLTEEQKKKYRLLDNKTGEVAVWDFAKLDEELKEIDFENYDFGFPDISGIKDISDAENKKIVDFNTYQIIIDCNNEAEMEQKYNELKEMGIECRISTL